MRTGDAHPLGPSIPTRGQITIYEACRMPAHPGFARDLTEQPDWAPLTRRLSENEGYGAPALSLTVFGEAVLSRPRGIAFDDAHTLIEDTLKAQRFVDPELKQVSELVVSGMSADLSATGRRSLARVDEPILFTNHGGYTVFGHYLFETLTSLWAMRSWVASGQLKILMPFSGAVWPAHLLDVLGVPQTSRYQSPAANLSCRSLAVASSCTSDQTFFPMPRMHEMVAYLKATYPASGRKHRLYLTRRGARTTTGRQVENEAELVTGLQSLGFIPIEPSRYSFDDQIRIFSQAEAVVGLHGSAFANIVFSPPGTLVVDLLPESWSGGRWIKNMTHCFRHRYFYVVCRCRPVSACDVVTVDVPLLIARLRAGLAGETT